MGHVADISAVPRLIRTNRAHVSCDEANGLNRFHAAESATLLMEAARIVPPPVNVVIYCADIGSVPRNRFGWARSDPTAAEIERHRGGTEIVDLVEAVALDLGVDRAVAFGFESPLFVPVPEESLRLGTARPGEANRSWSAGAGASALVTGIVEIAWILSELRRRLPAASAYLDWDEFTAAGRGLFLWEAFVSAGAKATTHVDDAVVAVAAFSEALPEPIIANAVTAERPLSLLGAALVWSGWSDDGDLLHAPCLVIKATPPTGLQTSRT